MEDIKIYDFNFNLLHIENNFSSVDWVIRFNDIGTFEAHFPINSKIVKIVLENDYLIAVQGKKQAIITGKSAISDFVIYGKTPNFILSKRVTPNFTSVFGTTEKIAADIVENAFSDVDNFVVERVSGFDESINFWRNIYNPTFKVVSECLERQHDGHKVVLDFVLKQWIYKAIKSKSNDIIISVGNLNGYNFKYTEDCQDYVNGGYYEVLDEQNDENTWELIESDKEGIYKWIGVLGGNTLSDATSSLKTRKWEKTINFDTKGIFYDKDYSLGDIVTIKTQIGDFKKTDKKMIDGVNIWYENANIGQRPIFADI